MTSESAFLQISRVLHGTTVEGPGIRTAIWFQGCSIRCPQCINPQLFSPNGGSEASAVQLVEDALAADVEGLTLLGGEPFDQAGAAARLANAAQTAGLGVITFTGYTFEVLQERDDASRALLAASDLVVDGAFIAGSPDQTRALVGSTNQRFIHLTRRYADFDPITTRDRVEITLKPDGTIDAAGFLDSTGVAALAAATSAKRLRRKQGS